MTQIIQLNLKLSNAFLLLGKKMVLLDTGTSNETSTIIRTFQKAGLNLQDLSLIVHTHAHFDHCGSTADLQQKSGALVAIHKSDAPFFLEGKSVHIEPINLFGKLIIPFMKDGYQTTKIDLLMDKTFYDLSRGIYRNLTQDQRRIFANQGKRNWVKINGEWCYKPSEVGNVLQNLSSFENPYLLKFGTLYAYKRAADNSYDSLALFADLAIKDGGLRDGVLMSSRFTEVATPDHLSLNPMLNRFLTDLSTLDSDLHSRSEPSTTGFVLNATFLTGSSKVVFPDGLGSIKEGMRVTGASAYGIPDGTNGTTIIVEISDGAEKSAIMVDIDGDEVEATATGTGSVTIENTGALGGSKAEDQFQSFKMEVPYACAGILSPTGGGHDARSSGSNTRTLPLADNFIDDGINGPPRYGSQTQPKSTAAHSRRQV